MAIDWTKIYEKYKGLWVALKDDEQTVISSGKTLREAIEKAQEHGFQNPIMHRVPSQLIPYVGGITL